jgi:hypothetical protein
MTLIALAVTTGSTQGAGVFKVHTTTAAGVTIDTQLATGGTAPAITGGQLLPRDNLAFTTSTNLNCHTVSTGTITLGFNTSTAVPTGGKIVITVPFMYFSAADSTKVNTFSTGGVASSTTATCVGAVGTAAAGSTLTCTTSAAILGVGYQVMTLIAGAVTTGNAQAAGLYDVTTTTSGGATIDLALSLAKTPGGPVSGPPGGSTAGKSSASSLSVSAALLLAIIFVVLL